MSLGAHAQLSTATMFGNVTDSTGAVIPNATLTITQTQTNFTRNTKTNGLGEYRAEFLPVGPYTLKVDAAGFKEFVQNGVVLAAAQQATLNFTLQPGEQTAVVEVTAEVPLVNLGNSTLGATIDNREVDNLPIVDRNAYTLLGMAPGVQQTSNENSIGLPMEHVIINGSSDNMVGQVTYYLDGGLNMTGVRNTGNVLPNPDAIDQFRVDTNNFSAEYGRTGAGVVSALTKSGTNTVHGSVFYFHRETNFNSNSYHSTTRSPLHRNYFGATLGGPIKHDQIFFFGSYAGLREINPSNFNTTVPDASQRTGDFSENLPPTTVITDPTPASGKGCNTAINTNDKNYGKNIGGGVFFVCDPVTHLPIAGNRADLDPNFVALMDPVAQAVLSQNVPLPTAGAPVPSLNLYSANIGLPNLTNEFLIKGDFQFIPRHRFTLDYYQSNGNSVTLPSGSNMPTWALNHYVYRQQNANVSDVWTLSPHAVNQAWLSYTRMIAGRVSDPAKSLADYGSDLNVQGVPSLPDISVTNFFHLANAISGPLAGDNVYGLRDVYSRTIGRHTINAGGEAYLEHDRLETLLNNYGTFSFGSTTVTNASTYIQTGVAMADFLIGRPSTMGQDSPDDANENYWNWGLFLQDDWRIIPRLTLNLGVRYDVQTAPIDTQRRIAVFEPGVQSTVSPNAMLGQLFPGDPGVPDGGVPTNYNHISPRLGFTWDPYGQGKTVFHGGAGLFFDSIGGNEWMLSQNFQPFAVRETGAFKHVASLQHIYSTDCADFAGCVSPFPYLYDKANPRYVSPASLVFLQKGMRWPYNVQVNFGFQQQFTNNLALGVSYVGAFSRKIPLYVDNNAPIIDTTNPAVNTTGDINCRRPYDAIPFATTTTCANPAVGSKYMSNAYVVTAGQTTNYNGMQVTVDKRLSHHLSVRGFYIWSKAMASGSLQTTGNIGNSAATEPEDYYNMGLEKQLTDNDQRHQANIAFVWKPDYFGHFNPVTRTILNGWTISAITNIRSGKPFNITSGKDDNLDGDNNDRPNIVPGQVVGNVPYKRILPSLPNQPVWFNTAAYCENTTPDCPAGAGPLGLDGVIRPNSGTGPGYKSVDAAIFRDFTIYERVKFQFRGEATNVFNFVNLNNPSASLTSAGFGTTTSGAGMRQLQVGGRILF
ncbi:MAG TPA: carboxypeptidase regulatory-like domain-containing protein [Acidobacteriaceae bacterium]|jgi:outer membrane receptor protein involved in Fe transport|nr:carboxypeptidase regulatory-like domain-containing protein [Acidobacteriaceae bacterium]